MNVNCPHCGIKVPMDPEETDAALIDAWAHALTHEAAADGD